MKTKKQIKDLVNKVIGVSFKDGKLLEKKVLNFVNLFKSQPKTEAIELLTEYLKRLRIMINANTLVIESVTSLSQKQKDIIKKKFSSQFTIINTEFKLNPSLLGGLKVKIGDHIYEDSIMSRVKQIGEAIHG